MKIHEKPQYELFVKHGSNAVPFRRKGSITYYAIMEMDQKIRKMSCTDLHAYLPDSFPHIVNALAREWTVPPLAIRRFVYYIDHLPNKIKLPTI